MWESYYWLVTYQYFCFIKVSCNWSVIRSIIHIMRPFCSVAECLTFLNSLLSQTFLMVGDISLTKAIVGKYLKESYSSKLFLHLSIKKFVNLCFIPKLFSKVWQVQTTLVKWTSRHAWVDIISHWHNIDMLLPCVQFLQSLWAFWPNSSL